MDEKHGKKNIIVCQASKDANFWFEGATVFIESPNKINFFLCNNKVEQIQINTKKC